MCRRAIVLQNRLVRKQKKTFASPVVATLKYKCKFIAWGAGSGSESE